MTARIGVLMGGLSSEREVSLKTGEGVLRALVRKGHDAVAIDWTQEIDLPSVLKERCIEVVWNALHGTYGEDGCVQGLLECMRIPYTGSGVAASARAMDKIVSKQAFAAEGIPTPLWRVIPKSGDPKVAPRGLDVPLVVKPAREGSTVGISIVHKPQDLEAAVLLARRHHGETLAERFIAGREISVGMLDDQVLGTVEIRPKSAFYDYAAKYVSGDTEYLVPARLSSAVDARAREISLHAYRALGCAGHARVDLRIDEDEQIWVLEVNTLPGMTGTSLLPKIAQYVGISYETLVTRILSSAALRA